MKPTWGIILVFCLLTGACSKPENNYPSTPLPKTKTPEPIYRTNTPTESFTSTPTISIPVCDPYLVEYCIEDGTFFLKAPIDDDGTQTIDRMYPYGSTAGDTRIPHLGVEFYNASGTPVLSAGDGRVVYSGNDDTNIFGPYPNFYGNLVIIQHSIGTKEIFSLYGHLSKVLATTGQDVVQGEEIGEVGSTGSSIGSHLHFELRRDFKDLATTINPELWLEPIMNTGVLAMRFQDSERNLIDLSINVQYFPDRTGGFASSWQPDPYSSELIHENSWENIVLGNLPPGLYRISYYWEGSLFDRWVEIMPQKLTAVVFSLP